MVDVFSTTVAGQEEKTKREGRGTHYKDRNTELAQTKKRNALKRGAGLRLQLRCVFKAKCVCNDLLRMEKKKQLRLLQSGSFTQPGHFFSYFCSFSMHNAASTLIQDSCVMHFSFLSGTRFLPKKQPFPLNKRGCVGVSPPKKKKRKKQISKESTPHIHVSTPALRHPVCKKKKSRRTIGRTTTRQTPLPSYASDPPPPLR